MKRELFAQLRKTDGVIFLASAASVASQWCFGEITLAGSLGKPVFPLRLEADVRLGLIADVQWIDLSEGETAFARLFVGLRRAGLDPADSFAWDPTRSPYPGLESFSGDDAAVFFGRDPEIDRLMELLQPTLQRGAGRFVAVVGPSGSGKSSLVRAGLQPRLERLDSKWVVLPALVPGQQPTRNLAHCVAAAFDTRGQPRPFEEIAAVLRHGGAGHHFGKPSRPPAPHCVCVQSLSGWRWIGIWGRDESYLLRGGRLSAFDEWAAYHGSDVEPLGSNSSRRPKHWPQTA